MRTCVEHDLEENLSREAVVVVIDDDASCRAVLRELFESVGLKVKLYTSGFAFLEDGVPDATSCLVIEVRLPAKSGLKVQEELSKANVHVPIIFITGHAEVPTAVRAMKAGAADFLTKPFRSQDMIDAVSAALATDRNRREADQRTFELVNLYGTLTTREKEVMAYVTKGLMNKQIAGEMGLSEITVKVHRVHLKRKMRTRSVADLVRAAERLGLPNAVQ